MPRSCSARFADAATLPAVLRLAVALRFATVVPCALFLCAAVVLCPAGARAAPKAITLDALFAQFRALRGLEAHFHEEKRLALLTLPLVSEGTLHFVPPARLARHTTSPVASTLLIDGDRLMFGDGQQSETIPLDGNPVVRLFVDSFVKLLVGDRAALERIFILDLRPRTGGPAADLRLRTGGWELRLKPKVAPMTQVIDGIVMQGDGVVLSKMTISETSGDETVTTFDTVDTARRYSPAELSRVFSLPAR